MFRVFFVVLVLSALVPNFACAAEMTVLTGTPTVVGPQSQLPATARIWVDEASIGLGGNWGAYSPGTIINQLRDQAWASGKIGVGLGNGQIGQAITHRCFVTGSVEVGVESKAGVIVIPKVGAIGGSEKLVAKTNLTITVFNAATGQVECMVTAVGKADRSLAGDWAVIASRIIAGQTASKDVSESDLVQQAVAQAVSSLIQQLPTCTFILPAVVPAALPVAAATADNRNYNGRYHSDTSHGF